MMMRSVVHVTFPDEGGGRGSLDEPRRVTGQGHKAGLATADSGSSVWQLVTAHSNGQLQVWDPSLGSLKPVLRIGDPCSSCRSGTDLSHTSSSNGVHMYTHGYTVTIMSCSSPEAAA